MKAPAPPPHYFVALRSTPTRTCQRPGCGKPPSHPIHLHPPKGP